MICSTLDYPDDGLQGLDGDDGVELPPVDRGDRELAELEGHELLGELATDATDADAGLPALVTLALEGDAGTLGVPGEAGTLADDTDDVPTFDELEGLAGLLREGRVAGEDGLLDRKPVAVVWADLNGDDGLAAVVAGLLGEAGLAAVVSPVFVGLPAMLGLAGELATDPDAGDAAFTCDALEGDASCFWIFGDLGLYFVALDALDGLDGLGAAPDFDPLAGLLGDDGEYNPEDDGLLGLVPVAGEAEDDSDDGELLSGIGVASGGNGPASGFVNRSCCCHSR